MTQKPTDLIGNPIHVGDICAFAARRGNSAEMFTREVVEVEYESDDHRRKYFGHPIKVSPVGGGKCGVTSSLKLIVISSIYKSTE